MEGGYPTVERIGITKTTLPPCCLRINPNDSEIIYLGTYQLIKETGKRYGSIEIIRHDNETNEITKIKEYKTDGAILDLKISPFDSSIMISVHSTGNIMIWKINSNDYTELNLIRDKLLFKESEIGSECLITSLVFHPILNNKLAITTTLGYIYLINLSNNLCEIENEIYFENGDHDIEAWISEFCSLQGLSNLLISGGDDRKLIAHDIRCPENLPIWKTANIHDAGIVSILPSNENWCNSNPYNIWTGSYDDHVKSLDLRVIPPMEPIQGLPPRVLESLDLGGGVWRLIPNYNNDDNNNKHKVLACCMYDGGRILNHNEGKDINIDKYFKKDHQSITYGGDWKDNKIVTCSFYDNVVQIWKP
ncbi:hypothetical protein B5S33_g758 [[Candida] boidinii]|nr:hypothetical protein B5S33_g758 [[Candida] boidinii]